MRIASRLLAIFALAGMLARLVAADESGEEFFEKQVRPILAARCFECHSGTTEKPKGGLRLDSRAATLKGGDTGPAVVPGKPKESLLVDAINYGELYQMPPKSKLPADEIAVLTTWVEHGAPWPEAVAAMTSYSASFDLQKRKAEHWCWQPVRPQPPPSVRDKGWVQQPLDCFVLAKLDEKGLTPSPRADRATLLRRASFDLLGLPPPREEVESSTASYEQLIDRLLASPRFGERWARHWLDLVRYAESRGHEFDYNIPNAFEYRDYVIRALNADVPYDQFLIEHVAGDSLKQPRLHPVEQFNESILGTGFWFLGEWCHSPVDIRKDECERIDNMLDVFSKTFLGVTVACARCHDHKFDAISQRDYYALAGYLQSSSYRLTRFEMWQRDRAIAAELAALDAKFRPRFAAAFAESLRPRVEELATMLAAEATAAPDKLGVLELDLKGAETIVDYARLRPGEWMTDGPTFGDEPTVTGQIILSDDPEAPPEVATYSSARRDWAWEALDKAAASETDPGRLNGWMRAGRTLKTPTFTLQSGFVHYLIEGAGRVYAAVDSHWMNNGPLHTELIKDTGGNSDLPLRWITQDLSRYVGQRVHLEFTPKEDEDLRVLMVVEGRQRPAAPTYRANQLLSRGGGDSCRQLVEQTLDVLARDRIGEDANAADRAAVANWLLKQIDFSNQPPNPLAAALPDYQAARKTILDRIRVSSRLCLAMWDGTPTDENLLIRGNHKTVGPVVPRANLTALSGSSSEPSNRLELAQSLVDRGNPLASRVIVNRVWQHLLGRGIVASVDNFGVLGQKPTHPELLDYLAEEFMRHDWSLKWLIRTTMLSSTYCQRSEVGDQGSEEADPQNLLFHRQNLKRLEGEAIRDAMLAVSGRLDSTMFGPSIPVHLTPFMQGRGRPKESGPLDSAGRRSVYVAVRRNFLSPMMLAFDTPIPFTTIGRRNVSNVPAQALILMNDPFVVAQSRQWASRVIFTTVSPVERIRRMYLAAFSRPPSSSESSAAISFLEQQTAEYTAGGAMPDGESIWADLAHVLLNSKEMVLLR